MGSKLISVIVSLMVVVGVVLVPAAVSAYPPPGPTEVGFNMPATIAVAPGSSFTVNLTIYNPNNLHLNAAGADVVWDNASLLNVTDITDTDWPTPDLTKWWDNATGELAYEGGGSIPIPWLNATNITHCVVHFVAANVEGVTAVNFIHSGYVDTLIYNTSTVDVLNWTAVTNMTVTISNGSTCCVNMSGNGNVTIETTEFAPPGGCLQAGSLNYTFDLLATPDGGWVFDNWSGNVDGVVTANPNTITINNGATDTVIANFSELANDTCLSTGLLDFGDLYIGGANPANKTFDVTNCGGGILNWSATLNWLAQPGANATIDFSPQNGTGLTNGSSDTVDVAVNITGETASGVYTANISVNPNVTVTFNLLPPTTIIPCRNITLPHVTGANVSYIYAGEAFTVAVNWTVCQAGNISSVVFKDNTTVTNVTGSIFYWDNVNQVSEVTPADAKGVGGTGNTSVEYQWYTNFTPGTNMSVFYNVTVPVGTAPGWYNMTVCPDNSTAWIEYYIGGQIYINCVACEFQIYVAAPVYVEGTVWEVVWNWVSPHPLFTGGYHDVAGNLTLTGVNVTMVDTVTYFNISNATGYYNVSVAPGNYTLSASFPPAFAAETYGWVNLTGMEGVVVIDFIGVNGLEPNAPFYVGNPKHNMALSYAARSVNAYLITPSVPAAALTLTEVGNVTACWLATL